MWLDNPKIQLVIDDVFQKFDQTVAKSKKQKEDPFLKPINVLYLF